MLVWPVVNQPIVELYDLGGNIVTAEPEDTTCTIRILKWPNATVIEAYYLEVT